jgi:hypothetical protein
MAALYGAVRGVGPSLVLVAGSGLGDGASAALWLSGAWAVASGHSLVRAPFDGVLVAPHEEHTSRGRWVHVSYRGRVHDFLLAARAAALSARSSTLRAAAVVAGAGAAGAAGAAQPPTSPAAQPSPAHLAALLVSPRALDPGAAPFFTPGAALAAFGAAFPEASALVLSGADYEAWLGAMKAGGKPVPFVPAIDGDFEEYFKKDSLSYSEDLAAVVGRDAGRVCILHGPVAARHFTVVNEPVGDILRSIERGLVASVAGAAAAAPAAAGAGAAPALVSGMGGVFEGAGVGAGALDAAAAGAPAPLTFTPLPLYSATSVSVEVRAAAGAAPEAVRASLQALLAARLRSSAPAAAAPAPLAFLPTPAAAHLQALVSSAHLVKLLPDAGGAVWRGGYRGGCGGGVLGGICGLASQFAAQGHRRRGRCRCHQQVVLGAQHAAPRAAARARPPVPAPDCGGPHWGVHAGGGGGARKGRRGRGRSR